jgi:nitroreductase
MEFTELIEQRRSHRAYEAADITEDDIRSIIYAAQQAPSWKNFQTGRYYIALTEKARDTVANGCLPQRNAEKTVNAVCYIITTFVKNKAGFMTDGSPDNEVGNGWGAYDLGLQNENLILRAKELGYDSLIMGLRDSDAIRDEFSVPETEEVMAVIALGRGSDEPKKPVRKDFEEIAEIF